MKNMNTPVNPRFSIYKWGIRGYSLHEHVLMMNRIAISLGKNWSYRSLCVGRDARKPVIGVSNQVRQNPACTDTERR